VHAATCDKFNRKVEAEGVTDEHGNAHPGAVAYTTYSCGWHRSYIGEITRKPGNVCIRVTKLNVTFDKWSTERGKVTVADWRPTKPQSTGCRLEETWFREEALDHERWHIGDINKVVTMATTRWRKRPPKFGTTCKGNEKQARTALEEKIDNRASVECDRIEKDILKRAAAYDAHHAVPGMDCRHCCGEGETLCPSDGSSSETACCRPPDSICCDYGNGVVACCDPEHQRCCPEGVRALCCPLQPPPS
jgi:hypothetical protein